MIASRDTAFLPLLIRQVLLGYLSWSVNDSDYFCFSRLPNCDLSNFADITALFASRELFFLTRFKIQDFQCSSGVWPSHFLLAIINHERTLNTFRKLSLEQNGPLDSILCLPSRSILLPSTFGSRPKVHIMRWAWHAVYRGPLSIFWHGFALLLDSDTSFLVKQWQYYTL